MTVRVLFVSKEYQPLCSGVARHIQGLAQALLNDPSVALHMLAPTVGEGAAPLLVMRGGYRRLWGRLGRCDLVHLHGSRTSLVFCTALLARLRGLPVMLYPALLLRRWLMARAGLETSVGPDGGAGAGTDCRYAGAAARGLD